MQLGGHRTHCDLNDLDVIALPSLGVVPASLLRLIQYESTLPARHGAARTPTAVFWKPPHAHRGYRSARRLLPNISKTY